MDPFNLMVHNYEFNGLDTCAAYPKRLLYTHAQLFLGTTNLEDVHGKCNTFWGNISTLTTLKIFNNN